MHPERLTVTALAEWIHLAILHDRYGAPEEVYPAERRAIAAHLEGQPERRLAVRAAWHELLRQSGSVPHGQAKVTDAEAWFGAEFVRLGAGSSPQGTGAAGSTPEEQPVPMQDRGLGRVRGLLQRLALA